MDRIHIEQIIQKLIAACNQQDRVKISMFFSDDFTGKDITLAKSYHGIKDLDQNINEYFSAFTDMRLTSENIVVEGNQAAVFWTASGMHSGILWKIPPSFKRFSVEGVWLLEIKDDRIFHGTSIWDLSGFLRRIRLIPNLPHEKFTNLNSVN